MKQVQQAEQENKTSWGQWLNLVLHLALTIYLTVVASWSFAGVPQTGLVVISIIMFMAIFVMLELMKDCIMGFFDKGAGE